MKTKSQFQKFLSPILILTKSANINLVRASVLASLAVTSAVAQTTYYWDSNGPTAGFGNTTGTWGTSAFWSASAAGTDATAASTTTSADTVNFGTTLNYGNAAVAVASGGVTVGSIAIGSGQTTALTLGTAANTITVHSDITNNGAALTIASPLAFGSSALAIGGTGTTTLNIALPTGTATFTKNGSGRVVLPNVNTTYTGPVVVNGGVLQYGDTISRLTSGNISLNGGAIEQRWTESITKAQGTAAGQIQIIGGESGFSENGSTGLTWNIGSVTWGSATFNPSKFVLQTAASQGTSSVTFSSAINLNGVNRTVIANAGVAGTATSTISGAITNSTGTAGLIKEGPGLLTLSGANTFNGGTTISAGSLMFPTTAAMPSTGAVSVNTGATLAVGVGGAGEFTSATSGAGSFGGILAGVGVGTSTVSYSGDVTVGIDITGTNVTYSGVIANPSGATSLGITKFNGNNLTLSGANTYTGVTRTNGGGILVSTIGNTGLTSSPLGVNNTAIDFTTGGELEYTGTGETSNRLINISGTGGTIRTTTNSGALVLSAAINPTSTVNKTLTLLGTSTLANTISGNIANGAGGTLGVTKNLAGTWVLSGTNSYTGATTLTAGTLVLEGSGALPSGSQLVWGGTNTTLQFKNDSNRTITNSLNTSARQLNRTLVVDRITAGAAVNLQINNAPNIDCGNVFNFQAGAAITSGMPTITFSGGTNSSDSNNGTIAGGTSATGAVRLNPTGVNVVINGIASSGRTRGYILDGTSTGNRITGTWANGSGTEVQKTGTGTWTLAGTSQYTLSTTISNGTLKFERTSALYNGSASSWTASNIRVQSGATLAFNVGGTNEFTTGNVTTLLTNLSASSSATNGMNAGSNLGFDTSNASGGTFTISNVIENTTGASGGNRGVTKLGTGSLVLTGANTYEGATIVSSGTLELGATDVLPNASPVTIGSGTLNVATFTDTLGTLDVSAAASVSVGTGGAVAFADSSAVDWSGGNLNITGSFTPGSSVRFGTSSSGLTSTQLGSITVNGTGAGTYGLDSNGFLIVGSTPVDPYSSWSGGNAFAGDPNNDGVANGLAFLLGAASPTATATNLLPASSQASGNLTLTFTMLNAAGRGTSTLALEHSSDLGVSDAWSSVTVPDTSGTVSGITFTVTPGSPLNTVTATIPASEAAAGKVFGRLKAQTP